MSRTIIEVARGEKTIDEIEKIILNTVSKNNYVNKIVNGENIWVKGDSVITLMLCFTYSFTDTTVILQGWSKDAILGESELKGFMGGLPNKIAKKMIEQQSNEILS